MGKRFNEWEKPKNAIIVRMWESASGGGGERLEYRLQSELVIKKPN